MSYREESLQRKEPPSLQALPFYALFWIGTRRQLHRHRSDESGLNTSFNATWGEPITTYCGAACKRVFLEFRQLSCALKYETSFRKNVCMQAHDATLPSTFVTSQWTQFLAALSPLYRATRSRSL